MDKDTVHTTFSRNPFAVFAQQPVGVCFEEQARGEKIILLLRAHLITLVPVSVLIVILLVVPVFLPSLMGFLGIDVLDALLPTQVFLLFGVWYLFVLGFVFYKFIFWYFNVYLLTNERVVDFDFRGILHKQTSYANLNQIQDVSPRIIGFFGTFFHYGHVYLQTAGEKPEFEFYDVARPDDVAREILEQVREEEGEAPGEVA